MGPLISSTNSSQQLHITWLSPQTSPPVSPGEGATIGPSDQRSTLLQAVAKGQSSQPGANFQSNFSHWSQVAIHNRSVNCSPWFQFILKRVLGGSRSKSIFPWDWLSGFDMARESRLSWSPIPVTPAWIVDYHYNLLGQMGVPQMGSNGDIQKWLVYNGKSHQMDDLGVPLFQETSKWVRLDFQG